MKKYLSGILCLVVSFGGFAEESEHERVGVKKDLSLLVTPSFDLQYQTYYIDQVEAQELVELVGISAEIERKFSLNISLPASTRFLFDKNGGGSIAQFALGDLGIGLGLNLNQEGLYANTALNVTMPTSGQASESKYELRAGSGMWNFGLSAKLSVIRDPVLIGFGIEASTSPIPVLIKGEESRRPYDLGFKVSLIQIINSEISTIFYSGLGIHSGLVKVSDPIISNSYVDIPIGCLLGISIAPWQFNLGISVSLQDHQVFSNLSVGASYAIEIQ